MRTSQLARKITNLRHLPQLLLLCIVASFPPVQSAVTCVNDCSNFGVCVATASSSSQGVCQCLPGHFEADCSLTSMETSVNQTVLYSKEITGLLDQKILWEWMLCNLTSSRPYLHSRWCIDKTTWFGIIINPMYDGMTDGDTWISWVAPDSSISYPSTLHLQDSFSLGQSQPQVDTLQDLHIVNGWMNETHQCMEFKRLLDTGDQWDAVLSSTPGESVRIMWTTGLNAPSKQPQSVTGFKIGKHGYIGYTGQLKVDFAAGQMELMTDGVKWPLGYWYGVLLALACLVLPFGLISTRPFCRQSRWKLWSERRPWKTLTFLKCFGDNWARSMRPREKWWIHRYTLQILPTIRNATTAQLLFTTIYLAIMASVFATSIAEYTLVGRSPLYVFGHLSAIHLALMILPINRNSFLLDLFNVGIDTAIEWHRRLGNWTLMFLIAHLVSMLVIWDPDILLYTTPCQHGMGVLFGTLSLACFVFLFLFSIEYVRRNHYELFRHSHIILVVLGYVFALLHSINFRWLLLVPGCLLLFDWAMRLGYHPFVKFGGEIVAMPLASNPHQQQQQQAEAEIHFSISRISSSPNHCVRVVRVELHGVEGEAAPAIHPSDLHTVELQREKAERIVAITFLHECSDSTLGGRRAAFNLQPGSHLYMRVPIISKWQWHPFSVSSSHTVSNGSLLQTLFTLHIKVVSKRAHHDITQQELVLRSAQEDYLCNMREQQFHDRVSALLAKVACESTSSFTEKLFDLVQVVLDSKQPSPQSRVAKIQALNFEGFEANSTLWLDAFTNQSQTHHDGERHDSFSGGISCTSFPLPPALDSSDPLPFSVLLDGPYNALSSAALFDWPVLVLVAGGIGATPIIHFLQKYMELVEMQQAANTVADEQQHQHDHDPTAPSSFSLSKSKKSYGLVRHEEDEEESKGANGVASFGLPSLSTSPSAPRSPISPNTLSSSASYVKMPQQVYLIWSARSPRPLLHWFPQQMQRMKTHHASRIQMHLFQTTPSTTNAATIFSQQPVGVSVRQVDDEAITTAAAASSSSPSGRRMNSNAAEFASLPSDSDAAIPQRSSSTAASPTSVGSVSPPSAECPLPIQHGRPNLSSLFDSVSSDLVAMGSGLTHQQVAVFACGPEGLVDDACDASEARSFHFIREMFEY